MLQKYPRILLILLALLWAVNLLQAHFTELIYDEAYYWYYSQEMAWGYFDHPPMVALFAKLGAFLASGELGVRLVSTLSSIVIYLLLWDLLDHPKKKEYPVHFFVAVCSLTLVHAYGFFTLPDTPLLLFTALFLWVYRKFLRTPNAAWAVILGLVMASLMYSKYHAVLVILAVLASNLSLLKNKFAWLAVIVSLLAYFPHLHWLYEQDFVSIKYHLFERPNRAYEFGDFTAGYFLNLVAIFGLTFPFFYAALFKFKSKDLFERALKFLVYGVLLFFFISSFNRRIQTQWIIVVSIPMVIITLKTMMESEFFRKWVFRLGMANLVILMYLRFWLVFQPMFPMVYETHGNKKWVQQIKDQVGDLPVVFENSYRRAPMYAFYSGNKSFSLNNYFYRKNQYSIDGSEERVRGQKVLYVSPYAKEGDISYQDANGNTNYGRFIAPFESYRKVTCKVVLSENQKRPKSGDIFKLEVKNPYDEHIPLQNILFKVVFLNPYKQVIEAKSIQPEAVKNLGSLKARSTTPFHFELPPFPREEVGFFKVGIGENGLLLGLNGENVPVE